MSETHIQVCSPATDEPIGSVPIASPADVAEAAARARSAQVEWAERSLEERCRVLRQVKNVIIERTDEICNLLVEGARKAKN